VILEGDLSVYEPRGQYQLLVRSIELQGVGALQLAFEKLKQKLDAEGLFATERKRSLPKYPQRIGLVTSPTGAAIRDVLHVIERRNPSLEVILAPCRVQGDGAADEIASAIRMFNDWSADTSQIQSRRSRHLDLILVTRGGGSLEDLWAFNEEAVARAIFDSAIPVVSAVGHEIDFTISDFVADVRAATPSAAAEIITEGVFASREFLAESAGWMRDQVRRRLERDRVDLESIVGRLYRLHPRRKLNDRLQLLDELQNSLQRGVRRRWRECTVDWEAVRGRLYRLNPRQVVARRSESLGQLVRQMRDGVCNQVQHRRSRLATALARIQLLSPANVIERGYSLTMDAATGKLIRDAGEVRSGQQLKTRIKRGEIISVVETGGRERDD
jgi:exodeoxyribonuclease VII large subunit